MKKISPDISREEELLETFTLAAPWGRAGGGRGHIVPVGSVSRPLRVNRQSYELEIL